jgi:nucleotide-binding universal stress UspA family protein/Icc-related predicted phosphoesterase
MQVLLLHAIGGQRELLRQVLDEGRKAQVGAIFVTGNLVDPSELPGDMLRDERSAAAPYIALFDLLASLHRPVYVVPGEHDAPLSVLNHAVQASAGASQLVIVHRTAVYLGDGDAIAGFGGVIADQQTAFDPWRVPAWELRVAFEHLAAFNTLFQLAPRRVFLFSMPPRGAKVDRAGDQSLGAQVINGVIRVYQPHLVVCGGPPQGRGVEMIDGTLVVNPGALAHSSYALLDLHTLEVRLLHLPTPLPDEIGKFETVLVALDGSAPSWHALEMAAGMARRYAARLVLLHAFDHVSVALGAPFGEAALAERVLRGERLLDEAAGYLGDLPYETELLEGPPAEAILRVAETRQVNLIVMGARGGGLRTLLGSVSQKVLRQAPCSVLITRQGPLSELLREQLVKAP